jgi:hypothetical protein
MVDPLARELIGSHWRAIDRAQSEVNEIAKLVIPDFHFLDYAVSNFWECDKSPIGWCVFKLEEIGGALRKTHCRYCGGPVERK